MLDQFLNRDSPENKKLHPEIYNEDEEDDEQIVLMSMPGQLQRI